MRNEAGSTLSGKQKHLLNEMNERSLHILTESAPLPPNQICKRRGQFYPWSARLSGQLRDWV